VECFIVTNQRSNRQWQTDLAEIVQAAVKPLTDEMKEMRGDIQSLKLTQVNRTDVYDRQVMDEKLGKLTDENKALREMVTAMKEFVWKALGGAGTVIVLLVYLQQHFSIH
jgi:hypothetical protein